MPAVFGKSITPFEWIEIGGKLPSLFLPLISPKKDD
jgi:hypothetical protein